MSYSINQKCWKCEKRVRCVDLNIVEGAVQTIHSLDINHGHLGGGVIVLECQNFVESPQAQTGVKS